MTNKNVTNINFRLYLPSKNVKRRNRCGIIKSDKKILPVVFFK